MENRLEAILNQKADRKAKVLPLKFMRYAAAAGVIIAMLASSIYFFRAKESGKQIAKSEHGFKNDILPGGNRAILTLADGNQIALDSADNGMLARQGNTHVLKLDGGEISYKVEDSLLTKSQEVFYNTIATPRGGQYQVVLPDGSKIWLNAESSLTFPTVFSGKERNVELTGEGYFEIAKNASKPFRVKVNDAVVEVLGTHFNINSYHEEPGLKTTLLEGSVKVINGEKTRLLLPGEQLTIKKNGLQILSDDVNIEQVLAWKNGLFDFSDVDLQSISQQLSRWYNVDIAFEGNIPPKHITGIISRKNQISAVLAMLEFTAGVHWKLEGSKVTFYQ